MPTKRNRKEGLIEKKIISYLRTHRTKKFNHKQLAAVVGVDHKDLKKKIVYILDRLERKKMVDKVSRGQYQIAFSERISHEGILTILPSGKGVVRSDSLKEDVFIPFRYLNKAFHGDSVLIGDVNHKEGRTEGRVLAVVERQNKIFTGILQKSKNFSFVQCRNAVMYTDFFIVKEDMKGCSDGDKVAVRFKSWPEKAKAPYGRIEKNLGKPGMTDTEVQSILHDHGIATEFPKLVLKEVKEIPSLFDKEEITQRRDFRETLTFTIDPIKAKDFDDALSFKEVSHDLFEIGIHIADVSHYVPPDSALDQDAFERGTSVYLVDRVVPMLPEKLSNGLCSLRPGEEKLTFSAVFHLDKNAQVKKSWFGKTVIHSDHRFSYEEVECLLDSKEAVVSKEVSLTGKEYRVLNETLKALQISNQLAKKLRSQRMKEGAISFNKTEVGFELDDKGNPIEVVFKKTLQAHNLIEEMMLLANRSVATFMAQHTGKKMFPYRIHDLPDAEKIENLKRTVKNLGYSFSSKKNNINQSINQLLKDCNGSKEQNLIETLVLRCMSKAKYTSKNIGHYGLSFDYYCHFSSPIRRYPDLMVHRILEAHLKERKEKKITFSTFEDACTHLSQREQRAVKAERDSIKFMQTLFMKDKVGQEFEGVISGVTERGIYVELEENKCEGFIFVNTIQGDYFSFDIEKHMLIGRQTDRQFVLGDKVRIVVDKVNVLKRYLDFRLLIDSSINNTTN